MKVATPVACRVLKSSMPSLLPVGSTCLLTAYSEPEVRKFLFDGSEDFLELAQAFFHHVAFSSGGKELMCDLQGFEGDDGSLLLIDPCIWRSELLTVGALLAQAVKTGADKVPGPSPERFDKLHPKCTSLCQAFDPQRKSIKRNTGICGMGATCGLGG